MLWFDKPALFQKIANYKYDVCYWKTYVLSLFFFLSF